MSVAEARAYHVEQISIFANTEADMVAAFTMNYPEEAIGVALAARAAKLPVAISFTLETDGRAVRRRATVSTNATGQNRNRTPPPIPPWQAGKDQNLDAADQLARLSALIRRGAGHR